MGRPKVQVSQQVANLSGELTYTNNTSNAQIRISPLGYNLGYGAKSVRGTKGGSDCQEERGTVGEGRKRLLYLNSHIRLSTI